MLVDVPFVHDELLGDGGDVVEDVLLLVAHAGAMPRLAVLAAAAEAGDGVDGRRVRARAKSEAWNAGVWATWKPP